MKTIHITFVNAPIASCVNPTLPLVEVLVRRGYRVTYAMSQPFISRVAAAGAEVIEYKFGAITAKNVDQTSYCRLAINTLAATRAFYEESIPDIVVYDYVALAGRILARKTNALAVKLSVDPAFTKECFHMQMSDPQYRDRIFSKSVAADKFLIEHGIESSGFLFHREKLNVFHYPKELEPAQGAIDESCIYAGRCAGEQVGFGKWSKPRNDDGIATIFVAPSRSYMRGRDYFEMCVAACSGMPWHVVLSIDDDADAAELSLLPSNFEIVQRTSHTKILPYADVVVGMGGFITASEAAYHGVPLVMTSCGELELEWACENVARVGIGVHLRGGSTDALNLRQAVLKVLEDTEIRNRMAELQRCVRRGPGAEDVVNKIEDILTQQSPGPLSVT